jgi:hypothetical protein
MACARVIVHGLTRISTDGLRKVYFFAHGLTRINTDGLRKSSDDADYSRINTDVRLRKRRILSRINTDGLRKGFFHGLSRMACLRKGFFFSPRRINTDYHGWLACARVIVHGLTRINTDGLLAQGFCPRINTD